MSDEIYKKIFSKNLNYYMELNHKSQIDIVKDLGYDKSAVSTWCNGMRLPRMDKVDALAKYLKIRRSDLIEERTIAPTPSDIAAIKLTPAEADIIDAYRNASSDIKAAACAVLGVKGDIELQEETSYADVVMSAG